MFCLIPVRTFSSDTNSVDRLSEMRIIIADVFLNAALAAIPRAHPEGVLLAKFIKEFWLRCEGKRDSEAREGWGEHAREFKEHVVQKTPDRKGESRSRRKRIWKKSLRARNYSREKLQATKPRNLPLAVGKLSSPAPITSLAKVR